MEHNAAQLIATGSSGLLARKSADCLLTEARVHLYRVMITYLCIALEESYALVCTVIIIAS